MNKTFTRLFAGALAAASLFALASCGEKKDGDDKSANASTPAPITEAPSVTDEPTAAPTEAHTPEPTETPEPMATPIPENWIIDPQGVIPPDVEILALGEFKGACIARVDGKALYQIWNSAGIAFQHEVPEEIAMCESFSARRNEPTRGNFICIGEKVYNEDYFFYFQDADGHTLFFEVGTYIWGNPRLLLATTDGKAIVYYWGDDFYQMHDFATEEKVEVSSNGYFHVGLEIFSPLEISWTNIPI